MVFILCGNFCQDGWDGEEGLRRYTRGFNSLAELLQSIPLLHSSHFVFVPGPSDPWSSTTLPRPSLPSAFTTRLSNRIPNAKFVSNPCRLKYFGMEIVICREDLMGKMMRNLVVVKEGEEINMKRYVSVHSALIQLLLIRIARSNYSGPSTSLASSYLCPSHTLGIRSRFAPISYAFCRGPGRQVRTI